MIRKKNKLVQTEIKASFLFFLFFSFQEQVSLHCSAVPCASVLSRRQSSELALQGQHPGRAGHSLQMGQQKEKCLSLFLPSTRCISGQGAQCPNLILKVWDFTALDSFPKPMDQHKVQETP